MRLKTRRPFSIDPLDDESQLVDGEGRFLS